MVGIYTQKKPTQTSGFTIVELLIVIVVIAILAAIATVAYRGIQERARASDASAALVQAKKKLELYKVDAGSYPTTGNLANAGVADGSVYYQYTSDGSTYCLTATSATVSYRASNTAAPEQGGCAGHGQGGAAAITNLAENPSFETNLSGWVENGGMPIVRTNEWSASGQYSLRDTNVNDGWSMQVRQATGTSASTGEAFSVQATVRAGVNPLDVWIRIDWFNSVNAFIGNTSSASPVRVPANSTGTLQAGGVAPANTASARVRIGSTASPTGSTMYVDSIILTKSAIAYTFFDGNSSNWIWNGTPNNSTSTGPSL